MANAGFNAATDIFSMGESWKVTGANLNASTSVAECQNYAGDVTHRDVYAERIAPTADYQLVGNVTSLPALGTVVTIDSKKVAISSIAIKTAKGAAVTATVTGTQVEDEAASKRTYACGAVSLKARHQAQDILGVLGETMPTTVTETSFTFSADVTLAEPKGVILASDVSNGSMVAEFTHVCADGSAVTAPTLTGTDAVVSAPVSVSSPENDYVQTTYSVTKSLTGTDAA